MAGGTVHFPGADGQLLAARLDMPDGPVRAYALFAHCFSCSKDVLAASRTAHGLARHGIAVLRFDFTGLGASEGEFANTNFSSNIADLVAAADFLRAEYAAPQLLVGHSLGGAAVLAAAASVPETRAVATIAAPSDPHHILGLFDEHLDTIGEHGEARVKLAGREFTIRRQFIEDITEHRLLDKIQALALPLLVMHSPLDRTVALPNAMQIFGAARQPKSFVSLDGADHLLTRREDAQYVAGLIAAWSTRYLDQGYAA